MHYSYKDTKVIRDPKTNIRYVVAVAPDGFQEPTEDLLLGMVMSTGEHIRVSERISADSLAEIISVDDIDS